MKPFFAFLSIALLLVLGCSVPLPSVPGQYHAHADFMVYIDGAAMDFNKAKYMSTEFRELSQYAHLHDFNPAVIHFHAADATLGDFFASLGMAFNGSCFSDGNHSFCSRQNGKRLALYVNGDENPGFGAYIPNDLDKILIFFGEGSPTKEMSDSVTNWACIYSKKCPAPEGFVFPPESCSGLERCTIA